MIDKLSPLYAKGVRPIPVIPTVYTDALSYGEQVGIIGEKVNEVVNEVNELVDDYTNFKIDIAGQINAEVDNWLDEHPEATTTVEDNSITEQKFTNWLKAKTIKDYITPEMFGATGDGVVDDTTYVQDAYNYCVEHNKTLIMPNKYFCTQSLNFTSTVDVIIDGEIITEALIGVVIGNSNNRNGIKNLKINIKNNYNSGNGRTGVQIINPYYTNIVLTMINGFETGVEIDGDGYGAVYCNTFIQAIANCKYGLLLKAKNNGWVNENLFIGGAIFVNSNNEYKNNCVGIKIEGSTLHYINSNYFLKPCLEGLYKCIDINYGFNNTFEAMRGELSTIIATISGGTSHSNYISVTGTTNTTYEDTTSNAENYVEIINNVNKNIGNEVYCNNSLNLKAHSNATECNVNEFVCEYNFSNNTLKHIGRCTKTNSSLVFSGNENIGIMVDTSVAKQFFLGDTSNNVRRFLLCFDSSNNLLDDNAISVSGARYDTLYGNAKGWILGGNQSYGKAFKLPDECKKIFIGYYAMSEVNELTLYANAKAKLFPNNLKYGLSSIPTCESVNGDTCICNDDSSLFGWKYYNGWNEI